MIRVSWKGTTRVERWLDNPPCVMKCCWMLRRVSLGSTLSDLDAIKLCWYITKQHAYYYEALKTKAGVQGCLARVAFSIRPLGTIGLLRATLGASDPFFGALEWY